MRKFPLTNARALVRAALAEDIGCGDITTNALVPAKLTARAVLLAKADGVSAGLPILALVFGKSVKIKLRVRDGEKIRRGQRLAELRGPARALLRGERTALNFIQRLSGIATLTRKFVAAVGDGCPSVEILDTRKTTPTLRALEKYAVSCGGGTNHRFGLYDQILIKDNHLALLRGIRDRGSGIGVIGTAIRVARRAHPRATLEIECTTLAEVREATEAGADIILLDNMTPAQIKKAVALIAGRAKTEASGGITLAHIAAVAATGVDYISIGALTHSAPALDLSLEVE